MTTQTIAIMLTIAVFALAPWWVQWEMRRERPSRPFRAVAAVWDRIERTVNR